MTDSIDYDRILRTNLARVFNERDADRRLVAIREIYADDAVLYDPDAVATGHTAISDTVTALLATLPSDFAFEPNGPATGHHGAARLRWQSGPRGGPVVVTGTDVALFAGERIGKLYVFLDPVGE